MLIVAKGRKAKHDVTIKVTKDDEGKALYDVSGCDPFYYDAYIDLLKFELERTPVFAGSYIPQDPEEDVNILNVLQNYYFDKLEEITAKDIKPIPHEEGVVY